ncbi:hypothetical protein BSL78_26821 [Apostichopus japonicus]|uniref:Uncharacterized protein n=1 Tax=Stichopus japonicus TaxID=307972 RepID=A0A2G8JKR8_STIJA|nr:hypothetical protein BSL78_26821 [Apostichopus japonicus]
MADQVFEASPTLYDMMVGRKTEEDIQIDDVIDGDVSSRLNMIKNATSDRMVADQLQQWVTGLPTRMQWYLYDDTGDKGRQNTYPPQTAFVLQMQSRNRSVSSKGWKLLVDFGGWLGRPWTSPFFIYIFSKVLKFLDLKKLFKPNWSEGTLDLEQEEDSIYCFEQFLMRCEAGQCGTDVIHRWKHVTCHYRTASHPAILHWCADAIPPMDSPSALMCIFLLPQRRKTSRHIQQHNVWP